jgi:osmotically-inducible protein OsmY
MTLPEPPDPAEQAAALFRHSGYPFLNMLCCTFQSGILILTGTLPTYQLNNLAQALAERIEGVEIVENRVEVMQRPPIRRMS